MLYNICMIGQYIGATLIFLLIGYLIGSISWAIILSKVFKREDIRTKGSGNAGATNTLRNYGFKIGFMVFVLDICKTILAVGIAFIIKEHATGMWSGALVQMAGLGAIVGHVFPIFFKFQGGKGSACFLGFFISMQWILAIIGFFIFMSVVYKSKLVSFGSLLTPFVLIIIQVIFGATNVLQNNVLWVPLMKSNWWINTIFISVIWCITAWTHRGNIKRLLNKTERKLGTKKI